MSFEKEKAESELDRTDRALRSIAKKLSWTDGFMIVIEDKGEVTVCSEERVTYSGAIKMLKAMILEVSLLNGCSITRIMEELKGGE